MFNGQRFSKKSVSEFIDNRISILMEEYDLPHPHTNGTAQIDKIKLQKHPKHSVDIRIYVWGEMSALYELVDDIHWN